MPTLRPHEADRDPSQPKGGDRHAKRSAAARIWQSAKDVFWDLKSAYDHWVKDDGAVLASSIAYYMALSFFPLLLVLIAGLGLFFQLTNLGQSAERDVFQAISQHFSAALETEVRQAFAQVRQGARFNGPLGLVVLLLGAMTIFAQLDHAFDRIWNVHTPSQGIVGSIKQVLFGRLRAFFMLFVLGLLMIAIFVISFVLAAVQHVTEGVVPGAGFASWILQLAVNLFLNAFVFALIYRTLSKAPVRWREALQGGILAALVWEAGRQIVATYLVGSRYNSAYGVVGSFIAVMLWVYYGVTVLLFGAEYVQVVCERCKNRDSQGAQHAPDS